MKIIELFENHSLEQYIDDSRDFDGNGEIKSLLGLENEIINSVYVTSCKELTSLKGLPKKITGLVRAKKCGIESLQGIGKDYLCQMYGFINLENNPIKSHILGLLKIKGLSKVFLSDKKLEEILNKYIPLGNVVECAEELIENGYKEMAQL